jgi:hypothetical protein
MNTVYDSINTVYDASTRHMHKALSVFVQWYESIVHNSIVHLLCNAVYHVVLLVDVPVPCRRAVPSPLSQVLTPPISGTYSLPVPVFLRQL